MTILVTGARGGVGSGVLHGLLAAGVPASSLRGAGRDPALLDLPAGVTPLGVDIDDRASVASALEGVEQVFLYAGANPGAFADAARDTGVRHVVVLSSISATDADGAIGLHHRAVEDALAARGLTTTALRPEAFATNSLGWADEIRASGTVSTPYPDAYVTPIHESDIADVAVAALVGEPLGTVTLTGPRSMSFRDQVGVLAHELGRDLELVELTPEQFRARMTGAPAPMVDALLGYWAAAVGVPQPVHDVEPVLGHPGRTYAQWARDHRSAFTDA